MKILIGPDSLKDSVTAAAFCEVASRTITDIWPDFSVISVPLADGGEGTVDALVNATLGKHVELSVTGPLGDTIKAQYGLIHNSTVGVIEMASASGLPLVPDSLRNPMLTTTYGTGEMILDAIKKGCKKIIIGIGGSATNDAGLGMMQALGFKCLNKRNEDIDFGGNGLNELDRIVPPTSLDLSDIEFLVACDVNNPLYGKDGAAHIYAGQKGADDNMINLLDIGLKKYAAIVKRDLGISVDTLAGGGAAGGLGAALFASLNAKLKPGFEIIRQTVNLDALLKQDIDLVITAEGQMNHQSLNGKLPIELAKLSKSYNIPTVVLVGSREIDYNELTDTGIIGVFPISNGPMTLEQSMKNGLSLIKDTIIHVVSLAHNINS